jgi:hypothetical protein
MIALACGIAALHLARVGFAVLAVVLTTVIVLVEGVIHDAGIWHTFTTWLLSACLFQVGYVLSMIFSAFFKPNDRISAKLALVNEHFWSPMLDYFKMKPKHVSQVNFVDKQKPKDHDGEV